MFSLYNKLKYDKIVTENTVVEEQVVEEIATVEEVKPSDEVLLLTEIRDLLRGKKDEE